MSVGTAPRRGRPRDESIDAAILEATIQELLERGFLAMSMESIAARAGIAKTTLYRRWTSTTELGLAALRTFESEHETDPPDGSARDQLVWLLERTQQKWGNPRYAAILRRVMADAGANPDLYRQSRDRLVGPQIEALNAALRRCVDEGVLAADTDVEQARRLLVSPIMVAGLTWKTRVTRAEVARNVDVVLRGLAP